MKQIRQEQLTQALNVLEEVFKELDIDFYVIGAIATEHWYRKGNKRMRLTKDIDFAILVSSVEDYDRIKQRLKEHHFTEPRGNVFEMISPQSIQVDLLPFGNIAIDDSVKLSGDGMSSIRVHGFMEVYQAGTALTEIEPGHIFKAATLQAIVLLKLIAYDDRPEHRQKDARDVASIIHHFFHLQADFIYDNHVDLFAETAPARELEEIAAIVIGREMKQMSLHNEGLRQRLLNIVSLHMGKGQSSAFVQQMVAEINKPVDEILRWLEGLRTGLLQ